MNNTMNNKVYLFIIALGLLLNTLQASTLKVCVTVPELGDLASIIGGEHVEVKIFVKGQEDPHALVAKPSDVLDLSKADAFILLGMAMETGWAPALIDRSRNTEVRPGKWGYIDTSSVITPIHDHSSGLITRAMGDVHPEGNPHYMLDPVNGLKVARLISASFSEIKPSLKDNFIKNLKAFESSWGKNAFGEILVKRYGLKPLVALVEKNKLNTFLAKTNESQDLSGWFGIMAKFNGVHLVSDHEQWVYFGRRFNLNIERSLEPKPGVPAGSKYLKHLVEWMNAHKVKAVLASPYFNPRHLTFIQQHSGAKILPMAHQAGSRAGTATYLAMMNHNINQIELCFKVN
jgi:zinc/manganese transport system substrate-binding protein